MKLDRKQLVRTAVRENNTKRPYLLVNPSQGKHVPVAPHTALQLFSALAEQGAGAGGNHCACAHHCICRDSDRDWCGSCRKAPQSDRFHADHARSHRPNPYLCFSETHSHARNNI